MGNPGLSRDFTQNKQKFVLCESRSLSCAVLHFFLFFLLHVI